MSSTNQKTIAHIVSVPLKNKAECRAASTLHSDIEGRWNYSSAGAPYAISAPQILALPVPHDPSRQHQQAARPPDTLHRSFRGAPEGREDRARRSQWGRQVDAVPADHR